MSAESPPRAPEEIRELAELVREGGFDALADWLEDNADEREEVSEDV